MKDEDFLASARDNEGRGQSDDSRPSPAATRRDFSAARHPGQRFHKRGRPNQETVFLVVNRETGEILSVLDPARTFSARPCGRRPSGSWTRGRAA